jgi:excisionase family DNA binding protein
MSKSAKGPESSEFLTVREAAIFLGVSERSIHRWIALGLIPVHHFGRAVRIRRSDLEEFIRRSRDQSS